MKRYLIIIFCMIAGLFSLNSYAEAVTQNSNSNNGSFNPEQVKEIQKIIYDYLVNNPEVLVKVSEALQEKQAQQAQKEAMNAITKNSKQIFNDPNSPTAGNSEGPIEIVEFFDYQCGHCKAMAAIVETGVKDNKNIKIIFKELPIFGGSSRLAAKAALAASKQGKYYAFHNALFKAKAPLDSEAIYKIAEDVGLDVTKLKEEMKAPWINQQIVDNFKLAQQLKLMGTPAFIFSNQDHTKIRFVPGATSQDNFKKQIAAVSEQ